MEKTDYIEYLNKAHERLGLTDAESDYIARGIADLEKRVLTGRMNMRKFERGKASHEWDDADIEAEFNYRHGYWEGYSIAAMLIEHGLEVGDLREILGWIQDWCEDEPLNTCKNPCG